MTGNIAYTGPLEVTQLLVLSDNAAAAIADFVRRAGRLRRGGVRIQPDAAALSGMEVEVTSGPMPGDEVVEKNGARVFLDRGIVDYLSTKELDAQVALGRVMLTVRDRITST